MATCNCIGGSNCCKFAQYWPDAKFKLVSSGLEDDPWVDNMCRSISHNPPSMMVIPQGKIYRHICTACGKETIIRPMNITCVVTTGDS